MYKIVSIDIGKIIFINCTRRMHLALTWVWTQNTQTLVKSDSCAKAAFAKDCMILDFMILHQSFKHMQVTGDAN